MSEPVDVARFGTPLTPAERRAIAAFRQLGTVREAAAALGKSPATVNHQLATARVRQGVRRSHQLQPDEAA
jgi:DNA-binding CsgD family transcriptional regulator